MGQGSKPVSYTHLDVYKRQHMICMSSLDSLILLFDCCIQKKDFYETGSGVTCLLYTSRCV